MKISPVPIPETPRLEPHTPKGADSRNMSDGTPFLAVINECREESDPAIEIRKSEAGTEAGGGGPLDAAFHKPDSAGPSRSGIEAGKDSGPTFHFPIPARNLSKTSSREPTDVADTTPPSEKEDPVLNISALPAVTPQIPPEGRHEMDLAGAGLPASEVQESSVVGILPSRLPDTLGKAGGSRVQVIEALPEAPAVAAAPREEIPPDAPHSSAAPSVRFSDRLESAPPVPAVENTVQEAPAAPSLTALAPGRGKSAEPPEPILSSVSGSTNSAHEAAGNTAATLLASSHWRSAVAGKKTSANASSETQVADPANLAEAAVAPPAEDATERAAPSGLKNPEQRIPIPGGNAARNTIPGGSAEESSILRNPAVLAAGENPSVTESRPPAGGQPSSQDWLSEKTSAGGAGDVAHPSGGKPETARTSENEAQVRRPQTEPISQGRDAVAAPPDSGGMRKTETGIKVHGPSLLFSSGNTPGGETLSVPAGLPTPPPAARTPELLLQLADRIQVQLRNGENEIRIQLKPELLGQLEIRAESGISGIVARIAAESGIVREYLENNLSVLHQSLQDQGLKIDRVEVVLQDSFDTRQSAPQQQSFNQGGQGGGGTPHHRAFGTTVPPATVMLNELVVDPMTWSALGPNSTFHTVA